MRSMDRRMNDRVKIRKVRFRAPFPQNRTGGSPASGSPVDGLPQSGVNVWPVLQGPGPWYA